MHKLENQTTNWYERYYKFETWRLRLERKENMDFLSTLWLRRIFFLQKIKTEQDKNSKILNKERNKKFDYEINKKFDYQINKK